MDLDMPRLDGIEATRRILADRPGTAVLVLTAFSDLPIPLGALEAVFCSYLLKDVASEEVARASGPPPAVSRRSTRARRARVPAPARSPTRWPACPSVSARCWKLLVEGLPNKMIARRLEISEKTVKSHLTRIFRVLDVTDRTQAALWAERHGLGPKSH